MNQWFDLHNVHDSFQVIGEHMQTHLRELLSNLVYGRLMSGGFPVEFTFINSVDELHVVDDVGELSEAA